MFNLTSADSLPSQWGGYSCGLLTKTERDKERVRESKLSTYEEIVRVRYRHVKIER